MEGTHTETFAYFPAYRLSHLDLGGIQKLMCLWSLGIVIPVYKWVNRLRNVGWSPRSTRVTRGPRLGYVSNPKWVFSPCSRHLCHGRAFICCHLHTVMPLNRWIFFISHALQPPNENNSDVRQTLLDYCSLEHGVSYSLLPDIGFFYCFIFLWWVFFKYWYLNWFDFTQIAIAVWLCKVVSVF